MTVTQAIYAMDNDCLIKDEEMVILKSDTNMKIFHIKRDRKIYTDKVKFSLNGIIGERYGSVFEVKGEQLVKVGGNRLIENQLAGTPKGSDNRDLCAMTENQKLSQGDIEKMKQEGVASDKIIEELIENSKTFKSKTEYSQEKYVKKKRLKHERVYRVLRPTARLLAEMHFEKNPHKIGNLRGDSLAQMLHYANVHAGATVAVVDTCSGLVVGSVLEKMGGMGKVLHLYDGDVPRRNTVDDLNFSKDILNTLYSFPLNRISSLECATEHATRGGNDELAKHDTDVSMSLGAGITEKDTNADVQEQREKKTESLIKEARKILLEANIDCLLIASKYDPTPLVTALYKFIAPARPIVVHCQYQEPLMQTFTKLKGDKLVVNVRLSETWLRHYQVLPERTHPEVGMSGSGGFLLTATTVSQEPMVDLA